MFNLSNEPLASLVRPKNIEEFVGQTHLLAKGKPLFESITKGHLHSMLFWGPPGTGKTSLARIIANSSQLPFKSLSAIDSGIKEIRSVVEKAKANFEKNRQPTVLFIDEVHRYNKAQLDVFLPYIEQGEIIFIGATTENPSFELTPALLSRVRVYVLKALSEKALSALIERVIQYCQIEVAQELKQHLATLGNGDARRTLNYLQLALELANLQGGSITFSILKEISENSSAAFDKKGEHFYDLISALHKSIRGSAPDPALYWYQRMMIGGCPPNYLLRRLLRVASEDIGNADPRALQMVLNAWDTYERLGSPEGELAISQAVIYLAVAPKSNAVYKAHNTSIQAARQYSHATVPLKLRNAPSKLLKNMGYGKAYRYAHDEPYAYAAGENYWPSNYQGAQYYQASDRGLEKAIGEKLRFFSELDKNYAS